MRIIDIKSAGRRKTIVILSVLVLWPFHLFCSLLTNFGDGVYRAWSNSNVFYMVTDDVRALNTAIKEAWNGELELWRNQ